MNEKMEAPEIRVQSRFLKWLDNFWYHYKWHSIAVLFILIVVVFSTMQCSTANKSDITVTFSLNYNMQSAEQNAVNNIFSDMIPQKPGDKDEKTAALIQYSIYTDEELNRMCTRVDPDTGEEHIDPYVRETSNRYNIEQIQTLRNFIMTGECAVWVVSPYVYETMFQNKVPVTAVTELKNTAFYQYYDAIRALPEETLLVLVKPLIGNMSKEENYRFAEEYFRAITEFTSP